MAFTIDFSPVAMSELKGLRPFDQRRIVGEIESQLPFEPTVLTRNRKPVEGLCPAFEHNPPVWELQVGEYRVFYDVDADANVVRVRAIRRKRPQQTTEEIVS